MLFCLSFLTLIMACRGRTNDGVETEVVKGNNTAQAAPKLEKRYPSLPADSMGTLYQSVDYIDFVFYYADFSMNQSDPASIKATMGHVAAEVPDIDPSCQPIASLFFQSKGKELIQAELYYTDKCVYFIWLVNGKRTYANKMTPSGFSFYERIFSQVSQGN